MDGDTEGNTIISKLEPKAIGIDGDGNVLSSCIVVPVEDAAPRTDPQCGVKP